MKKLFLLFNHTLTTEQEEDARISLGVGECVPAPAFIQDVWKQLPPEVEELEPLLEPVYTWLEQQAAQGDYLLVQGDFGATYLTVSFSQDMGLIPVYSTTQRQAVEQLQKDGSVALSHRFRHVLFRRYGK